MAEHKVEITKCNWANTNLGTTLHLCFIQMLKTASWVWLKFTETKLVYNSNIGKMCFVLALALIFCIYFLFNLIVDALPFQHSCTLMLWWYTLQCCAVLSFLPLVFFGSSVLFSKVIAAVKLKKALLVKGLTISDRNCRCWRCRYLKTIRPGKRG